MMSTLKMSDNQSSWRIMTTHTVGGWRTTDFATTNQKSEVPEQSLPCSFLACLLCPIVSGS